MEWSHLGLKRRPFTLTADVEAYFPSTASEAVIADLRTAHQRGEGFALLDGSSGVGKTFTALAWLDRLPADALRVWLPNNPAARPTDLLQAILFDLNLPYQGLSEQELRLAVTAQLLDSLRVGQPLVLVIDEAQHLSAAALEELRLLGNVENRHGKGLFTVLVAQPSLRENLKSKANEAFAQRLSVQCEVPPLSEAESHDFLRHQVRSAGGSLDEVFAEEAVALLAASCGGKPRVISRAAGLACDLALAAESETVDVEAVLEALTRLGIEAVETDEEAPAVGPAGAESPTRAANSSDKFASDKARETLAGLTVKPKSNRRRPA